MLWRLDQFHFSQEQPILPSGPPGRIRRELRLSICPRLSTSETESRRRRSTAVPPILAQCLYHHINVLRSTSLASTKMCAESVWFGALRVYNLGFPAQRTECLLVRAVEEVVGRVPLELSLTHSAGGSGGSSTLGVQTLDEGDVCQELAARWPLLISDGLQ